MSSKTTLDVSMKGASSNIEEKTGDLRDKKIVEAHNQISKGWFILAITVGALVGGTLAGFGAVGLLHSHGLISFSPSFQWLASAIGTIGHTPHFWSLWAISAYGILGGVIFVALGSYHVHKLRKEEKAFSSLFNPVAVETVKTNYLFVLKNTYYLIEEENQYSIVIRDQNLDIKRTELLSKERKTEIIQALEKKGYRLVKKPLPEVPN